MPQLLETVVALQAALDHLTDLEQQLSGVPEEMRELHEAYTTGRTEMDRLEGVLEESESERRTAEAAAQDCTVKLQHFQEQVNRVKTQREYAAILQEIDQVKAQSREFEDQALGAMERQEEAETEIAGLRETFDDIDAQYQVELEKWEAARPGVADEAEALRSEIGSLRDGIPPPSLSLYERLRDFTEGQALAVVRAVPRAPKGPSMWHCSACNYNVRPQAVVEIRQNGSLIQCDSCKRLLYMEESTS